jgi:hypothetical protein
MAIISPDVNVGDYEEFLESSIWAHLSEELQNWLHQVHEQLETEVALDAMYRLQGNAEAIRRFMQLPVIAKEILSVK